MIARLLDRLAGGIDASDRLTLRVQIFRLVCLVTAGLCLLVATPMNLTQNIPLPVHVVTIVLGISGVCFFVLSRANRNFFGAFLALSLLQFDFMWFWNAGSRGSITFYFLPVLVFSLAIYPGRKGLLLFLVQVANVGGLFALEHVFPTWVSPFTSESDRLIDLITSVVAACVATALIVAIILHAFDQERRRLAQAAEKLKASEERQRLIFNASSDALFVHQADGRLVDFNDRACELFGFDRETGLRLSINDYSMGVSPYSEAEAREQIARALGGTPQVFEWRSRRRNGELFWSEVALRAGDFSGERYVIASVRDISARRCAEQELVASEERLRLAMLATQQGWFELNLQTGAGFSSPEYIRIIGYDPETFKTSMGNWMESIHPDDQETARREFRACIETGETRTMEYRRRTASGSWKWIRSVGQIVERDSQGRPVKMMGTHADITERKELQQQLLHSQRLEAVGTLASGVAHDLNNTLTPMLMSAGFLRDKLPDPDDRELMTLIEAGAQRSASIVKQLLAFSRSLTSERHAVDPGRIVQEIASIMRSTLPKEITLVVRTKDCPFEVEGDPTHLHQVLMNLCLNARDAMPHGGTLTLGLESALAPAHGVNDPKAGAGLPHVVLSVTDNGTGIPPEVRDKIFDPFFTTKAAGQGTGLGLASVHGIVTAHGGFVRVESEVGRGSTFRVFLPGCSPKAPANPSAPTAASAPSTTARMSQCILVVDDEPSVLKTTQRLLASHGYETLGASGGAEALKILGAHSDRVKLVITDFMMPEMDGATLLPLMRQIVPGLQVIGVSGLDQRDRGAELGFSEVLWKPYDSSTLLPIVSRLLQKS